MRVLLPYVLVLNDLRLDNSIRQIGEASRSAEGTLATFARGRLRGSILRLDGGDEILLVPKVADVVPGHSRILQTVVTAGDEVVDLRKGVWVRHPLLGEPGGGGANGFDHSRELQAIRDSWVAAFSYAREDPSRGIAGLRGPQIGAVHSAHAHWTVSDAPATIVMPTGTGKTDTMISILVSVDCPKLLVIVPTDALRTQLAEKFLTLGILKDSGCTVLSGTARYPIVGTLQHIPRDVTEVDQVFERCQVIITTSSIAGRCAAAVQDQMAYHCPYLFIDEAHHAEAPTWSEFKERFRARRILQFTATPFREDGKPLDGQIIYKYPLKRAQEEGYFRPIRFAPVSQFNRSKSDESIAVRAIAQLRADADKGHVLMARVDSVERAKKVFELYRPYAEFNPVQLHTGIKSPKIREELRRKIMSRESRIVVCVDMLGEGFDLPELKIAAFHDIRKTLAVTLQLAGRFTRARQDLGDATFIANTADVNVQDELRKLYTRDPDWNVLLPELSEQLIGEQLALQDFLRGFTDFPGEISLETVRPATSAVVYQTTCETWSPDKFVKGIPGLPACEQVHHTVNEAKHTLVVVTARRVPLSWTEVESLFSWEWELLVVVWSPEQNLLFINSSSNAGEYKSLAQAIAGQDATLIRGQDVFRIFSGVNRLRLQNVGLTEQLGRNIRYTGRMGSDVEPAMTEVLRRRGRKAVLAGTGYEHGGKTTVGASRKGRIWSFRKEHVAGLAAWCEQVGAKLLDTTIDPDEVLKGTLDAKPVMVRPAKMPIGIDWPEEIYKSPEAAWTIVIDEQEWPLSDLSITLLDPTLTETLQFEIASETTRVELALEVFEEDENSNYRFTIRGDRRVQIRRGGRTPAEAITVFFYEAPPMIWFVDGSSLEGNEHVELKREPVSYDATKIDVWDWTGTDLTKESQGAGKEPTSIQARVIRELVTRNYEVVMDDDGKGEVADVVAIRSAGEPASPSGVEVDLYHCKFSGAATPGRRIKDLYELCGQAQKSISWMSSPERQTDIFTHLLRREASRLDAGLSSRFEVGDADRLQTILEVSRVRPVTVRVFIVQPGVSKANATRDQLELISVTENHLMETYQLPFGVISSA